MKLITLALTMLMFAVPAFANQHGHGGSHGSRNGGARGHEAGHARPEGRNFGREHFRRFNREDARFIGGRPSFFFGGFWFDCGFSVWPEWFYGGDVYFAEGPDGFWYAYSYARPSVFIQVYVR